MRVSGSLLAPSESKVRGGKIEGLPHREDVKIIRQEVHGGEDIKKHIRRLIWKQSVGRICRNRTDLAAALWPRKLGAYFSMIQFPYGRWADFSCCPIKQLPKFQMHQSFYGSALIF